MCLRCLPCLCLKKSEGAFLVYNSFSTQIRHIRLYTMNRGSNLFWHKASVFESASLEQFENPEARVPTTLCSNVIFTSFLSYQLS